MKKSIFLIILLVFIVGCDNKNVNNIKENNNESKNSKTKIEYYCEDGYTLDVDQCVNKVYMNDAKIELYCDSGYKLENDKCVKYDTKDTINIKTCDDGYKLVNNNCYREQIIDAQKTITCTDPYELSGERCAKTVYYQGVLESRCKKGTKIPGAIVEYDKCKYEELLDLVELPGGGGKVCPSYYCTRENDKCRCPVTVKAELVYSCKNGGKLRYPLDCVGEEYGTASISYKCNDGYELSSDKCIKKEYKKSSTNKGCENGYTLLNGKCVKIKETKDHSSKYTCEDGLLLDDGKCYKEEIIEAKKKK